MDVPRRLALVALVLLLAPSVAAQPSAEEFLAIRAAAAPAQTIVDGAARVVGLSLEESDRDGTPDEALDTLEKMASFILGLEIDWPLPDSATHREIALDGRAYGRELHEALFRFPGAAANTSVIAYECGADPITPAQRATLTANVAEMEAIAVRLDALANAPPTGVDASALASATARIASWIEDYDLDTRCLFEADPFLHLEVLPGRTWPTGRVRIVGGASAAQVIVAAPTLGLERTLTPVSGRFGFDFVAPEDAALGPHLVRATAGALAREATLTIERAPSEIVVRGPTRVQIGAPVSIDVQLLSPLRDRVALAALDVSGDLARDLQLADARATLRFAAPDAPQRIEIAFAFAGTPLVAPSSRVYILDIVAPPPAPADADRGAAQDGMTDSPPGGEDPSAPSGDAGDRGRLTFTVPVPFLTPILGAELAMAFALLLLLLLLFIIGLVAAWLRRTAERPLEAGRPLVPDAPAPTIPSTGAPPVRGTFPSIFAAIVSFLRRSRRAPASDTPREIATRMRAWGADPGDLVFAFERARYGDEPAPPPVLERMRAWATDAWSRLRGSGS